MAFSHPNDLGEFADGIGDMTRQQCMTRRTSCWKADIGAYLLGEIERRGGMKVALLSGE